MPWHKVKTKEMIQFVGEYTAKVDDKGRVVFPSALKAQMLQDGCTDGERPVDMRFIVKKDLWEDCLGMYTFAEWERQSERIKSKINFLKQKDSAYWREYTRGRAIVEPEEKLGRLSIPKTLLESIGAGKELVFCGCDNKIEIWSKEKFECSGLSSDELISLTESLSDR